VTARLRIAVATAGRFHVLDLARELHALGHDVKFYSYVPLRRAVQFGLPHECHVSLLPFAFPGLALERFPAWIRPPFAEWLLYKALNHGLAMRLSSCDVLICMSGIYLEAAKFAKRRFGAAVWLHRGSQHVLSVDRILAAVPGAKRPSLLTIERELAGYELADRIVIASTHVERSFIQHGTAKAKLFRNPYGVDLAMFPPVKRGSPTKTITIIFVGTWSLQKGCDLLTSAVRSVPDARLVHVGAIGDLAFPEGDGRLVHVDAVPQRELAQLYAEGDIFVLASREDGFGNVLVQALASGLPVICTDHTGGADLAHTSTLADRIIVVPHNDTHALAAAISKIGGQLRAGLRLPALSENDRKTLTWAAYGQRYNAELMRSFPSQSFSRVL
jgi:glycosyltransferase involved in cell wall biosynthesis